MPADAFVVSCEHGGHRIPHAWSSLFHGREEALASHRGWDPGALLLARRLADALDAPLHAVTVSRLLCDTNRREGHPALFGAPVRKLSGAEREGILAEHHRPHRSAVRDAVDAAVARGERAIHLSVHTFTPVLDGVARSTQVGLLYDPSRPGERGLCTRWAGAVRGLEPELRVHRNRPYRGTSDGLTRWLRECFPPEAYLGIEVEVRSDLPIPEVATVLLDGLAAASHDHSLDSLPASPSSGTRSP